MADFTKPFTDFSLGEISPENIAMATSQDTSKGVFYLQNAFTNKTKGLERRTGTLKVAPTRLPVSSEHRHVRCIDFFMGRNNSYVGVMYFVIYGELSILEKQEIDSLTGETIADASYVLVMDFYKSEGTQDTFINTIAIGLDNSDPNHHYYSRDILGRVSTLGSAWKDIYGFHFSKYQTYSVVTHNSGLVEPFVIYYNSADNEMGYFLHSEGMYRTNPSYYPVPSIVRPFGLPFMQANLNPNLAIKVENYTEADVPSGMWFKLTSQYYDPSASDYVDWSSFVESGKPNPFDKFARYIRLTIGDAQYVLRYVKDVSGAQNLDLTLQDDHVFVLVLDSKSSPLATVVSAAQTTSDFNVEMFNRVDAYPDNSIFNDQRLVFHRDGTLINTGVGNAFFLNQYRFAQDTIVGVYAVPTGAPPMNPMYDIVSYDLLIDYSGQKQLNDAFDFMPLSESLPDVSWLNKGNSLELGGSSEVLNISGLEDSIYGFSSIRSVTGSAQGSKSSISIKAGSDTIFVDGNNRHIRNYYYDGRTRNYVSNSLNDINPDIVTHLMDDSVNLEDVVIREMSYDVDNNIISCIVGPQNALIGMTYHRDSNTMSWHRYTLGEVGGLKVPVHSSCFLRNDKSNNTKYIITEREDGRFWLERFAYKYNKEEMNPFEVYGGGLTKDKLPVYLDFATPFVGGTSSTWNIGLDYADKDVEVFADGFWVGTVPCDAGGIIHLDRSARSIVVGYAYGTDITFLECEPNFGGINGSFLHNIKHYNYLHFRLNRSYGGEVTNTSVNQLEKIPYDADNMMPGSSLKLFTGYKDIHLSQYATPDNTVRLYTNAPYPLEIKALVVKGESNER